MTAVPGLGLDILKKYASDSVSISSYRDQHFKVSKIKVLSSNILPFSLPALNYTFQFSSVT
jgi:hypothetical protein